MLQQASASRVAAHRASRLSGSDVHDVACSIGADLAAIAAIAGRLRPAGCRAASLVLTRIGSRAMAFLCEAVRS